MDSAPKGIAVWLGLGEFTHPDDDSAARNEIRRIFLETIREDVPSVLHGEDGLDGEPLALFRPLWERAFAALLEEQRRMSHLHLAEALHWNRFKYADSTRDPDAAKLRDQLVRWAQFWNLIVSDDDWIVERAVETLRAWCASPELYVRSGPAWNDRVEFTTIELTDEDQTIAFPRYSWDPQFERMSHARERIRDDILRRLTEQLNRICDLADDRLVKTKEQKSGDAHFRWLVYYQVLEMNWAEVAEWVGRADSMQVREDALTIAAVVGITPRQSRRGRPRWRGARTRLLPARPPAISSTENYGK